MNEMRMHPQDKRISRKYPFLIRFQIVLIYTSWLYLNCINILAAIVNEMDPLEHFEHLGFRRNEEPSTMLKFQN